MVQKSINTTVDNEEILQKTKIELERLDVESNERRHALQRAHTLFSEIEVLRKCVEAIVQRVEMILSETLTNCNSFQQAKNHLNQLKVSFHRWMFEEEVLVFCSANRVRSSQKCRT